MSRRRGLWRPVDLGPRTFYRGAEDFLPGTAGSRGWAHVAQVQPLHEGRSGWTWAFTVAVEESPDFPYGRDRREGRAHSKGAARRKLVRAFERWQQDVFLDVMDEVYGEGLRQTMVAMLTEELQQRADFRAALTQRFNADGGVEPSGGGE